MLLRFSVANFKSFRDEQAIEFSVSNSKNEINKNVFSANVMNKTNDVLKTNMVIGANASGKSNFVDAINLMKRFVLVSATDKEILEGTIPYDPFIVDEKSDKEPSSFEVLFVSEGITCQYGFSLNSDCVLEEWLIGYPKGRPQYWIERKAITKEEFTLSVSPSLKIPKRRQRNLKDSTRENNLVLSVANLLNIKELKLAYEWFVKKLALIPNVHHSDSTGRFSESLKDYTRYKCLEDKTARANVLKLMKSADVGISDLVVQERELTRDDLNRLKEDADFEEVKLEDLIGEKLVRLTMEHRNKKSGYSALFNFAQESTGTLDLFDFSGPLLDVLAKGKVLVIDELGSSLHPDLVEMIIMMFNNNKTNPKNAQLLFTSHAHTLLMKKLFRRDQIWITQKHSDQSTSVTPLADYHPRKNEAILKGYSLGRYNGIPSISNVYPEYEYECEEEASKDQE